MTTPQTPSTKALWHRQTRQVLAVVPVALVGLAALVLLVHQVWGWPVAAPSRAAWLTATLLVAAALGAWQLVAGARARAQGAQRLARQSAMLGQAADVLWELDARLRLVQVECPAQPNRRPSGYAQHSSPHNSDHNAHEAGGNPDEYREQREARSTIGQSTVWNSPAPPGQEAAAPWAELLGQRPWKMPSVRCEGRAMDRLRAHLELQEPFKELPLRWRAQPSHAWRHFRVSGAPRLGPKGQLLGYFGVARDVTQAQRVQAALKASEQRYRQLFALSPSALVLHQQGRVLGANPAALRLFGLRRESQLLGLDLVALHPGWPTREEALRVFLPAEGAGAGAGGGPMGPRSAGGSGGGSGASSGSGAAGRDAGVAAGPRAPGFHTVKLQVQQRPMWVKTAASAVRLESGPAVMSLFIDETETRQAQEAVLQAEALRALVFNTSPDIIALIELPQGRLEMVNRSFERLLGWTALEAMGRTTRQLGLWALPEHQRAFAHSLKERGLVHQLPVTWRDRQGRPVRLRVSAAPFVNDQRQYLVVNARDVSASERERQQREAILASAPVGVLLTRGERLAMVNRHFEKLVGWPAGSLVGQTVQAVWPELAAHERGSTTPGQALVRGEPVVFEAPLVRKDGNAFLAQVRALAVDPSQGAQAGLVWVVQDVSEQREVERKLAQAGQAAQAASRARSEFLANTSHELRTPLNAILGLVALAREPNLATAERDAYLARVAASAQGLAATVSDILELSRLMSRKEPSALKPFDLPAFLRDTVQDHQAKAKARGLHLAVQWPSSQPSSLRVAGDAPQLRQVLNHLLGNALKFTERGQILLRACEPRKAGWWRLEVQDSGPGVPEALRDTVFEPFTQADPSHTRAHGGSGLGLALCREWVAKMGGRMGLAQEPDSAKRPTAPSRGSVFWLEVPLPPAAQVVELEPAAPDAALVAGNRTLGPAVGRVAAEPDAAELVASRVPQGHIAPLEAAALLRAQGNAKVQAWPDEDITQPGALQALPSAVSKPAPPVPEPGPPTPRANGPVGPPHTLPPARAHSRGPLYGKRVLVVDDNDVNRLIAAAMLERWGIEVAQAADGQKAVDQVLLASAGGWRFDAVLMDLQMPVMSGYEAARLLRSRFDGRALPIIALTAAALDEERQRAYEAGMNAFLCKPMDGDRLHQALLQWCTPDSAPA